MAGVFTARFRRIAAIVLVVGLAFAASSHAQPPNTTYYAAIAFSKSTGQYGYSSGWLSELNARRDALKHCDAEDAEVVLVVGNGYAALAIGDDDTAYGYGYDIDSADEAERFALEACGERTTNCRIVVCVHSWAG